MNRNIMSVHSVVFLGGLAALAWEVLWLHFANLAIGVSAQAAAIILSAMMLGMAAGSFMVDAWLKHVRWDRTTRVLAFLEIGVGIAGLFLAFLFSGVERLDIWTYQRAPQYTSLIQIAAIFLVLGPPAFFMGGTVPVYARVANQLKMSLSGLYATNVVGASVGILLVSFVFIPTFGVATTIKITAGLNVIAAVMALMTKLRREEDPKKKDPVLAYEMAEFSLNRASVIVFCTGFSIFVLEVTWFRSLRAALQSTTESFALILFATLIALAGGGYLARALKKSGRVPLFCLLALAGFLVLQITPIIERFDLYLLHVSSGNYAIYMLKKFLFVLVILVPPMCALGIGLPWILEMYGRSGQIGRLYAVNTLGAVLGSLVAAWILLPVLGAAKGAWVAAGCILLASLVIAQGKEFIVVAVFGMLGFFIAVTNESGVGRERIQGWPTAKKYTVLESREGPDATVSAIEVEDGVRYLFIDGFTASDESRAAHYMDWMGRLPMLLNPDPKDALVICFGTGQTANSVRQEGPESLDIVDVSPAVFGMARHFIKNEHILDDPRVRKFVMDGRAFLRRTDRTYDIVTMEPMPPTFAGSNALYSLEFYQAINLRLNNNGVVAQWVPFHLVGTDEAASIVATFLEVFSDVILWIDPISQHGILLGFKRDGAGAVPFDWYGFKRGARKRILSDEDIKQSLTYHQDVLTKFAQKGKVITDNNQLLSYGYGRMKCWTQLNTRKNTLNMLNDLDQEIKKGN